MTGIELLSDPKIVRLQRSFDRMGLEVITGWKGFRWFRVGLVMIVRIHNGER